MINYELLYRNIYESYKTILQSYLSFNSLQLECTANTKYYKIK